MFILCWYLFLTFDNDNVRCEFGWERSVSENTQFAHARLALGHSECAQLLRVTLVNN
jgi:hypothetical protein